MYSNLAYANKMAQSMPKENQPFRVLKILGEGGYGLVQLVDHTRFGRVAYKTCPGATIDKRVELESEAKQHGSLRHPNVVILYGTIFNSHMLRTLH